MTNMKLISVILGLSTVLLASTVGAQTAYKEIKVGSTLDSKGIAFGTFHKPLPLPQGTWQVAARKESRTEISGGDISSTTMIALTLKSTTPDNSIPALVVEFSADAIPVDWNSDTCADPQASYVETLGTTTATPQYACLTVTHFTDGFKALLGGASSSPDEWIKSHLSALQPLAASAPDAYSLITLDVDRVEGRKFSFAIYAANRNNAGFVSASQQWARTSGQMLMNVLNNKEGSFTNFP
jgi:hypothetical protein